MITRVLLFNMSSELRERSVVNAAHGHSDQTDRVASVINYKHLFELRYEHSAD